MRTTHRLQSDGVLGGPLGAVQQTALLQVVHSLSQLLQLLCGLHCRTRFKSKPLRNRLWAFKRRA